MCEWLEFEQSPGRMRTLLLQGLPGQLSPFLFLSVPGISSAEQRECSELWIQDRNAAIVSERSNLAFRFMLEARDKLRIGYLSNDFHDHATSRLLVETLETHNRARFEVHAFSFGFDHGGPMRRCICEAVDVFHDIAMMNDTDAASAIYRAGIDILIDLKGYTRGARTGIMMMHPAPVQVNYLGYPGTLGAG